MCYAGFSHLYTKYLEKLTFFRSMNQVWIWPDSRLRNFTYRVCLSNVNIIKTNNSFSHQKLLYSMCGSVFFLFSFRWPQFFTFWYISVVFPFCYFEFTIAVNTHWLFTVREVRDRKNEMGTINGLAETTAATSTSNSYVIHRKIEQQKNHDSNIKWYTKHEENLFEAMNRTKDFTDIFMSIKLCKMVGWYLRKMFSLLFCPYLHARSHLTIFFTEL